jgi:protein-S-isoprenylcysteine O-methyltransferase Ste14
MSVATGDRHGVVSGWHHVRAVLMLPVMNTIVIPAVLVWQFDDVGSLHVGILDGAMPMLIAIALLSAGAVLTTRAIRLFVMKGEGTLAPWDPTRNLITTDIYRFSRNPMKSGLFLILLGESLLLGSRALVVWMIAFIAANVCYIRWSEEPGLRRRFGRSYDDYSRSVPRWLGLPRKSRHTDTTAEGS